MKKKKSFIDIYICKYVKKRNKHTNLNDTQLRIEFDVTDMNHNDYFLVKFGFLSSEILG